jgi:hypothetical protein
MDHRVWTKPQADTICTLMSRLYSWWPQVKTVAKQEPGNVKIDWSVDGSHFLFSWSHIQARKITLSQLKLEIIREAEEVKLAFADIIPGINLSTFDLSKVVDDPGSPVSLFDRPENKAIFEPYIQQLRDTLKQGPHNYRDGSFVYHSTGKITKKHARAFLARSETFLGKALVHFCKTIGIPPRAWQIGEFLFRAAGQYDRNVRLLNSLITYFGNPKAKQNGLLVYNSFWALVPYLGLIFIIYLGAYRLVEIKVMEDIDIPTAEHKHHIFVHMTKQKTLSSYAYSPTKVNSLLKGVEGSVIPFEARALRHIFTTIIEQQLPPPHMPPDNTEATVLSQGQHNLNVTKKGWYARDQIQRSTGLSVGSRNRQLAIGQTLQAWVGFVPANYEYSYYGDRRHVANIEENRQYALDLARSLILQGDYRIADGDPSTRKSRVAELMTLKPFLTGRKVSGILEANSEALIDLLL